MTLKSKNPLPVSMRVEYEQLFETDQRSGQTLVNLLDLNELCTLARSNQANDLLGVSEDNQKEKLRLIEHSILLNHSDSLVEL